MAHADRALRYQSYASDLFSQTYTRDHPEKVQEWINEIVAAPEPPGDQEITLQRIDMIADHDVFGRLGEITQPSIVICGDCDVAVGQALSEEMAAALPDAELVVLHDTGHLVELEQGEEFFRLVSEFITTHLV